MFLAKREPEQEYKKHIELTYLAWKDLVDYHRPAIQKFCIENDIDEKRFLKNSLLTVVFHDIGKLSTGFQEMMKASKKEFRKIARKKNYRHELASFPIVLLFAHLLNQEKPLLSTTIPLEALAVVGHHKFISAELKVFQRESKNFDKFSWSEGGLEHGVAVAQEIFQREGWELPLPSSSQLKSISQKNPYDVLHLVLGNSLQVDDKDERRRVTNLFFFLKGLLIDADWHASSGKIDIQTTIPEFLQPNFVEEYLKEKALLEGWIFQGLRQFQKEAYSFNEHVIAIAPTGSGKTEASLLWALEQIRSKNVSKIFYLLPTTVTATALHTRIQRFFRRYNIEVGLTHSLAELMTSEESDQWSHRRDVLFEKNFILPVTVATIDQMLSVALQQGRWALKGFNLAHAAIIIDEIHAYEPYTLGLLDASIKILEPLGAKFFIMSATMPQRLIDGFQRVFQKPIHLLKDGELLDAVRNEYRTEHRLLEDALDEVEYYIAEGKRVLIVVSTIKQAQELTKRLSYLDPICYHSRFILRDRQAIEERILSDQDAQLVIATQVVEVSLDIDFDVMLTDCAPPDALAQRAGRINRRRKKEKGLIRLFLPSKEAQKIYDNFSQEHKDLSDSLLYRTFQLFDNLSQDPNEKDLLRIVDEVYHDENPWKHPEFTQSQEILEDICNTHLLLDPPEKAKTRLEKYLQVPVIPLDFIDDVKRLKPKERRLYELKMPYWYVKKYGTLISNFHSPIFACDMDYSSYLGGELKEEATELVF